VIPFEEINQRIWSIGAELAASRLVTQSQIDSLILKVIVAPMFLSLIKKFSLDQ
jgi:hypothetical protein